MLIQAYVDDSGGKGQGTVFVFSALISSALVWSQFADAWKKCLEQAPSIRYFKMKEAAKLHGEFRRFTVTARDEKIERLCRIIAGGGLVEHHCVIKLDDFDATLREHSAGPMRDPYFFPFQVIILGVGYQLLEVGHQESFEIFFDEHFIFGPRAKAWYPVVRAMMDDDLRAIAPVEPFFRSDLDVLPLQAADLTAWLHRRENNEGLGEFKWIQDALYGLVPSTTSNRLTVERMREIIAKSYARTPDFLEKRKNAIEAYKETFGDDWPPRKKRKSSRRKT